MAPFGYENFKDVNNDNVRFEAVQLKNKLMVLVVEYSRMHRLFHKTVLDLIGVSSQEVENGMEAINLCQSGVEFDLIIMDMDMPNMEGITTTRSLRAIGVQTKILGLTSRSRERELQALLETGLDYCEERPLTPARLVSIIEEIDRNLFP